MLIDETIPNWLYLAVFGVAILYSAVGHGGASGYLALLALLSYPAQSTATCALILNILVASLSSLAYYQKGYMRWRACFPFLIGSVPAAFAGGYFKLPFAAYSLVLAICLALVACRLVLVRLSDLEESEVALPGFFICLGVGALIGFVSGMVGIGGGVFLTPIMVLFRWTATKTAACVSAVFIVINSLAGLAGRGLSGAFEVGPLMGLVIPGVAGGILGSWMGAGRLGSTAIRRVLAVVLLIAAMKLVLTQR